MITIQNLRKLGRKANAVLSLHTSSINRTFWEPDKKSGYSKPDSQMFPSKKKLIADGFKELRSEIALWKREVTERLRMDPIVVYRPGEVDIVYDFQDKTSIEKWVVTADSDHNEGNSKASLELTNAESGLFQGFVDSHFLKDGKIKRTGYANMRTLRVQVRLIISLSVFCKQKFLPEIF